MPTRPDRRFSLAPSQRNTSNSSSKLFEEANTRVRKSLDGDDREIGEESVRRKQSLNVLYMEMRAAGEASETPRRDVLWTLPPRTRRAGTVRIKAAASAEPRFRLTEKSIRPPS